MGNLMYSECYKWKKNKAFWICMLSAVCMVLLVYLTMTTAGQAMGAGKDVLKETGISGMAEILGGVLAWLILGSLISPVVMAAIMAAVAGIMVALSVDELMPLAKEIDPNNNPSYGVLCGMSVMGLSLVILQSMGIG